jgi:hypothetical protein
MSQLFACPDCKKHLQVPDGLMGKKVQCPECKQTFTARVAAEPAKPTAVTTSSSKPTPSTIPAWDKKDSSSSRSDSGKKKRQDDDDDDDDEDDDRSPRRRRSSARRSYAVPHRGGMILAFGLISLLGCIFIFGIIAWIMGNSDLAEMRAGRMDPEGEGLTQAGRILGMVSTIIVLVTILVVFGIFGCAVMVGIMGAAGAAGNRRRG